MNIHQITIDALGTTWQARSRAFRSARSYSAAQSAFRIDRSFDRSIIVRMFGLRSFVCDPCAFDMHKHKQHKNKVQLHKEPTTLHKWKREPCGTRRRARTSPSDQQPRPLRSARQSSFSMFDVSMTEQRLLFAKNKTKQKTPLLGNHRTVDRNVVSIALRWR